MVIQKKKDRHDRHGAYVGLSAALACLSCRPASCLAWTLAYVVVDCLPRCEGLKIAGDCGEDAIFKLVESCQRASMQLLNFNSRRRVATGAAEVRR